MVVREPGTYPMHKVGDTLDKLEMPISPQHVFALGEETPESQREHENRKNPNPGGARQAC